MENKYTYEDDIRITSEYLDKIDILEYIKNHDTKDYTISDLIYDLENDYNDKIPNDDFFEATLFNRMTEEDFEDYLFKRYGGQFVYFQHVTKTYLSIKR